MKKLICLVVTLLTLVLAACGASQPEAEVTNPAVANELREATLYTAQNIVTMNSAMPEATAVVVEGDTIIAVGDLHSVTDALPNYSLIHDRKFANKVLLPGFIDNHLHPSLAGILLPSVFITPFDWKLPGRIVRGVQGREAFRQRLVEVEAAMSGPQEMLITWGYHQYFHGELTRADLDIVSPTRPILVWQRSFHEIVMNSAAIEILKLDQAALAEHPAIDWQAGHFWETGLFAIFPNLAPIVLNPERLKQGIHDSLLHAQMNGITTVADQGAPLFNLSMELSLLDQVLSESGIPLKMLVVGNVKSLGVNGFDSALTIIDGLPKRNTKHVKFLPKQAKLLADGAFYSQLMQMEEGYLDGHHGEWIMPPAELEAAARLFWTSGYQLHIHVNGDKGVNVVLNLIAKLQQENPRPEHKTVLHHYGYSAPEHAEKISDMGIMVSANPYYLYALGEKYAEIGLGPARAHNIARLGDLERNGVSVSFHSDLPMAPAAPLLLASIAASRLSAQGRVLAPEQKMSIRAALRGITIEAARAIQQEKIIGSIEVGKQADFTVLDQDPTRVSAELLRDIPVFGTVLRGKFYARPTPL